MLADIVPTGATYVAGSGTVVTGTATFDESLAPILSWTVPSLASDATVTVSFRAQENNNLANGTQVKNTATLLLNGNTIASNETVDTTF